ncbi:YdgA family protein [Legionella lytica]|uniref:YdgA family protein n=1 Tax=Legionella lytica TaxID=96232 RepID=A0ABY4YA22_9GAMM|nr:YdgA family protein [Legionella lytica]USQ14371.1 YdgA family protein [Legionella lytica]
MKKLTGLIIILAALVLGGYYGMGILTEKTIRKNIEVIDQSNGLRAEIKQYNRGLFSSEAQIQWQLHIPEHVADVDGAAQTVPAQDYSMEMPLTIHHGPVIFANNSVRFGLGYAEAVFPFPKQYVDQFNANFTADSTKPQLDLSIFVNYFNQSTLDFNVPTFNLTSKDGGRFNWLGLNATTTMSPGMKKVGGTVVVDGVHLAKGDAQVDLGKVSSDYDLHETDTGLYLGDANFTLPEFNIQVKGQKIFEVSELLFKSKSDIEQHLFNTSFTMTIKSVLANAQNYGPGEINISVRNLDADVLAKINQQANTMQNGTEEQRQQAMIALLPELPKLFNKGAELEISKLNFKLPEGIIDGTLLISLPKDENANPFQLMQKIRGNAKLSVPAATVRELMKQTVAQQMAKQPNAQPSIAKQLGAQPAAQQPGQAAAVQQPAQAAQPSVEQQVDQQLNALKQAGLIVEKGTDYFIEVSLDQGKFTVNGKPFNDSMLKF